VQEFSKIPSFSFKGFPPDFVEAVADRPDFVASNGLLMLELAYSMDPKKDSNTVYVNAAAAAGRIEMLMWAMTKECKHFPENVISIALRHGHVRFIDYYLRNYYPKGKPFSKYSGFDSAAISTMKRDLVLYAMNELGLRFTIAEAFKAFNSCYTGFNFQKEFFLWLLTKATDCDPKADITIVSKKYDGSVYNSNKLPRGWCFLTLEMFKFYEELGFVPQEADIDNYVTHIRLDALKWVYEKYPHLIKHLHRELLTKAQRRRNLAYVTKVLDDRKAEEDRQKLNDLVHEAVPAPIASIFDKVRGWFS